MINNEQDHGTDDRDEHAVQVETGYPCRAKKLKQPAANKGPDNPEDYVEEETFSFPIHDLAGDEPGDQSENDPADDGHFRAPVKRSGFGAKKLVPAAQPPPCHALLAHRSIAATTGTAAMSTPLSSGPCPPALS